MNIIDLSIKKPVMMTMVAMFLIVMGIFSYFRIPLDMIPRVDIPIVTVTVIYPGAGPDEIETLIAKPIEDAVVSINGIDDLTSNCNEGYANIVIKFEMEVDIDTAAADVREKIGTISDKLPDDAEEPIIAKLDINALPIITISVSSIDRPLPAIYTYAKDFIKDELTRISGVAEVNFIGGREREIIIKIDNETLKSHALSINALSAMIAQKSLNVPSGHITHKNSEYTVRMDGEFNSVQEIQNLEIPLSDGKKIKLSDIAEIEDTYEEMREMAFVNAEDCIAMSIQKRSDANTTKTATLIKKKIEELKNKIPGDLTIKIIMDKSDFIVDSIDDLYSNLFLGVLITAIILYLFLHTYKGTLIAALSIPISIIATYTLIYFAGFTMNIMTLMALAISVGILVSNAIVVLENVIAKMAQGMSAKEAASVGTKEIAVAVAGATLTNVVVFVPIAFMDGMVGQFFKEFGLTVTFATFISLIIAFTLTPMLCSLFLKKKDVSEDSFGWVAKTWDRAYNVLEKDYSKIIKYAIDHKFFTFLAAIIIFIGSIQLAPYIGFEFITNPDQHEFSIAIKRSPGTSLTDTNRSLIQIENILKDNPLVTQIYRKVGKTEGMMGGSSKGIHLGELTVKVKEDSSIHTDTIMESLYGDLAKLADLEINIKPVNIMGGSESPIVLNIIGNDYEKLKIISSEIYENIKKIKGTMDVTTTLEAGKPEFKIIPKRDKLYLYGLNEAALALTMRGFIEGTVSTVYREGDDEYDIKLKLDDNFRTDVMNLKNLEIANAMGGVVPLGEVADIIETKGPTMLKRYARAKAITISSNVSSRSVGEVLKDIQNLLKNTKLPQGFDTIFTGEVERMEESFTSLFTSLVLALIFTYMLLAALLESFIHPFTILISFPLAFAGMFLGLFITGKTWSIFSIMAVVMLVGIVVNNGILLIENIRLYRERGMTCHDAVIKACPPRLRPIIMTTISACGAMVPLAMGIGAGGEMRSSMAIVEIGGMITSAALSIIIIPIIYYIVETFFKKDPALAGNSPKIDQSESFTSAG